jgi:hypothetical protein
MDALHAAHAALACARSFWFVLAAALVAEGLTAVVCPRAASPVSPP